MLKDQCFVIQKSIENLENGPTLLISWQQSRRMSAIGGNRFVADMSEGRTTVHAFCEALADFVDRTGTRLHALCGCTRWQGPLRSAVGFAVNGWVKHTLAFCPE